MSGPLSVEKFIEAQLIRWQAARRGLPAKSKPEPVICISRLPGCDGGGLGQELAKRLEFDFFDRELLHHVAQSARLSETIVKTVDEKTASAVEEWVDSLFSQRFLSGDYLRHLSKVLMTIVHHGRAVILGRGAGCILRHEQCLRVGLVAPLEERVKAMASRDGLSHEEAQRRVVQLESERRAFIQHDFHVDMLDPTQYDLVVNTAALDRETALATIQAAWEGKRKHAPTAAR
ncbi:MAG: cytidylate kinase-like family protein [Elusimicrobia bacterium]|nr:cytidylate kinase-like family protein [Elusimicrobiota bacterium]